MTEGSPHVSVLAKEVLEALEVCKGDRICDLTLGAGGHAEQILQAMGGEGCLLGLDRDDVALQIATDKLERFGNQFVGIESNFADAGKRLDELGWGAIDGALLDLGVSSMQIDDAERGFSFQKDGPLDMRMSKGDKMTATEFLKKSAVEELERVFRNYGEEPRARSIAKKIVELRRRTRLTRTNELAELVRSVCGGGGRIHPATRVFQAIRIAINGELEALEKVLPVVRDRLKPGRRLVVISFHSLEDRIVKTSFRSWAKDGRGVALTKRPVGPKEEEIRHNPRSRSSRLRVFEKGETG